MKKAGRDVEFSVAAELLGRGPVQIQGFAIANDSSEVASPPIDLIIQGDLAAAMRNTEAPKKK